MHVVPATTVLSVSGASAFYVGGGVIYTGKAMGALLDLGPDKLEGGGRGWLGSAVGMTSASC